MIQLSNGACPLSNQRSASFALAGLSPRFGCRHMVYVAPNRYEGQDEFIKQIFVTGGNSLKRQSQLPYANPGDTTITADEKHNPVPFNASKQEKHAFWNNPSQVGWGIAYSGPSGINVTKKSEPAFLDSKFDKTVERLAQQKPQVIMAHLLESKSPANRKIQDTHPFKIGGFALSHHGSLSIKTRNDILNILKIWHKEDSRTPLPKGKSDSERVACYLAAKMLRETGTSDIKRLNTKTLMSLFKGVATELALWSGNQSAEEVEAALDNGADGICTRNNSTFIVSDGQRVLISRHGKAKLYKGTHQVGKNTEYIFSTEKIQPVAQSDIKPIEWEMLPDHSLLLLETQKQDPIKLLQEHLPIRPHPLWERWDDDIKFAKAALWRIV